MAKRLRWLTLSSSLVFSLLAMASPLIIAHRRWLGPTSQSALSDAKDLIRQSRSDNAISKLEVVLEATPNHAEALMYMGTAYLYKKDRDFLKAKEWFVKSFQAGGGAAFWVHHSHEKFGTEDLADYCRGWFFLRKGEVEFKPEEGDHAFRLPYSALKEFKQNRVGKTMFHIKDAKKNWNFRPRSQKEEEVWVILALYQKFP
jgi:tetratricopeptide (TPR) repeat protein